MANQSTTQVATPQRWDKPFDPGMTDAIVDEILARPELRRLDSDAFPAHVPLHGLIKNDTRLRSYEPGEVVVREGDYGASAFLTLSGNLRVILPPGLDPEALGRRSARGRRGVLRSLGGLFKRHRVSEVRSQGRAGVPGLHNASDGQELRVFLQDVPVIMANHETVISAPGQMFGELGALGRMPRTATVFAETSATVLEMRWQCLRDLRRYERNFQHHIDELYRENALKAHLLNVPFFDPLPPEAIERIRKATIFEAYGSYDWSTTYKDVRRRGGDVAVDEPVIAGEGDYPDGLLMIRAGFARVAIGHGSGRRTLAYLGAGDFFGNTTLYQGWKTGDRRGYGASLTAIGYVHVLRIPTQVVEDDIYPLIDPPRDRYEAWLSRPLSEGALREWLVEERFINATKAMLIDLDRCTRCDDCVRACAANHDGNPRFIRHGKTFDHWQVANACMHCIDPVCMIGCPTGAIHRSPQGTVVINDDTCIGCQTCANACPYNNIRMVQINNAKGMPIRDEATGRPILKATSCDLCIDNLGGPACVRACPHDALNRVDFRSDNPFET